MRRRSSTPVIFCVSCTSDVGSMPPFFAAYACTNAGRGSNMITTEKHFSRLAMRTVSLITD